jgi:YD repeat-containing protein
VTYAYDGTGRLSTVTDPNGGVTEYTYDGSQRMLTIKDPQLIIFLTNEYDPSTGRVTKQTQADTTFYSFSYTLNGSNVIQTDVTDPRGNLSRATFNADGQILTNTEAVGTPDEQVTTYERQAGTNVVLSVTDALNRKTAYSRVTSIAYKNGPTVLGDLTYAYDKAGNRTKLGGTWARTGIPEAVGVTNYNAANRQLTFGDKTLTYDNNGNLSSIVDANGTTLYTWNARNHLTGLSSPALGASFAYDGLVRREQKTVNSFLTEFLFDGVNPVQESSGAVVK